MKTFVVLVVIGLALVLVFRLLNRSTHELSGDGQVIAQLKAAGSNLDRPHPMEFFLYFPSQVAAVRVSKHLAAQGFAVKIEPSPQGGNEWQLLAEKELIPDEQTMLNIRQEFSAVAAAEGGEYDGWGSSVVR